MTEKPQRPHPVLGAPEDVDRGAPDKSERNQSADRAWQALSYLIAGVGFYGFLGWLGDHYLHTHFLIGIGIVLGAAGAIFMIIKRYGGLDELSPSGKQAQSDNQGGGVAGDVARSHTSNDDDRATSHGHGGERPWDR